MATLSVAFTVTVTVPSHGAVTGVSIFITSMTSISSPFATFVPELAVTRRTVPGTVLRITANTGTKVSKGDEILVMDVMKMETPVTAPCDGTVTLNVAATDKVATGDVLATIG